MKTRYTTAVVAATSATAMLLSACSSDPAPTKTQDQTPTQATITSPLDEYLAVLDDRTSLVEWETSTFILREEVVAQCMTDKGFEYIPRPAPKEAPPLPPAQPMDESWVAANGFAHPDDDGLAFIWPEDTNTAYIQSLSASARDAYQEALMGAPLTEDEYAALSGEDLLLRQGCFGQASLAQEAIDPAFSNDFAEFRDSLEEVEAAVFRDPVMAAVVAQWSDCMADAGFIHSTREEMIDAAMAASIAAGDPTVGGNEEAIAAAADAEIETALADLACYKAVDWATTEAAVRKQVEEQYVTDNKAALDEYIAAVQTVRQEAKPTAG